MKKKIDKIIKLFLFFINEFHNSKQNRIVLKIVKERV